MQFQNLPDNTAEDAEFAEIIQILVLTPRTSRPPW